MKPGVYTALVTPFKSDLSLDLSAFENLVEAQVKAQVTGIIVCGSTGESPTVTADERGILLKSAQKVLSGSQTELWAGTGTNNTVSSIELSKAAEDLGVKGILLVTPYYNKPSQAGLLHHFTQIANAVSCEVLLYNVPGRSAVLLEPQTIAKLSEHPQIRGIKESSGNVLAFTEIQTHLKTKSQDRFRFLAGDDVLFLPSLSVGATGVVSVASNVLPQELVLMYQAWRDKNLSKALEWHEKLYPFFQSLFIESNPVPVKALLSHLKKISPHVRAPLYELSPKNHEKLIQTWELIKK